MSLTIASTIARAEPESPHSISDPDKAASQRLLQAHWEKARKGYLEVTVGGLHNGVTTDGRQVKNLMWVGILGRTNLVAYKPLPKQAFDAQLFDANGKEIKKTFFGRQLGKPLQPDKKLLDGSYATDISAMFGQSRELVFTYGAGDQHLWDLELMKMFKIVEPGDYRLQVTVRLFVRDTNGVFSPFILPPVNTWIKLSGRR